MNYSAAISQTAKVSPPTQPVPVLKPLLNDAPVRYNRNERRAVKQALELRSRTLTPSRSPDGSVQYVFGEAEPVIVCAPLRICDLALQPGEKVKDVLVGDSARWSVQPAMSGSGTTRVTHAVIKPIDVGLASNLMITTDRRVYHLTLKSARLDHMPFISFSYPESAQSAWNQLRSENDREEVAHEQAASEQKQKTIPGVGLQPDDLNFDYTILGGFEWQPSRVYTDGVRTYIELPQEALLREAPILLIPNDGKDEMINYRLKGNRYIIDGIVDNIVLLRGVGRHQERVQIVANSAQLNRSAEATDATN